MPAWRVVGQLYFFFFFLLVYANDRPDGTVGAITLLFTFIIILFTVRLPTHLEQTKSVSTIPVCM
jgi:hypothetical protein